MKKLLFLFITFTLALSVWAAEGTRLQNRGFEIGIADIGLGASNSFLGVSEFFQETFVVDLEKLNKGFKVDLGLDVHPFYFNVNRKDNWGFGLDIGVTVFGNIELSGNLLGFKKTDGDKLGAGAAAFVDVGIPVFFHINKLNGFKIKVRPAGYVPAAYLEPDITYTFKNVQNGAIIKADYALQLYTPMSLDPDSKTTALDFSVGVDLSAGAEYPLFSWLDLGVDITSIPIVPGSLSQYMLMKDTASFDSSKIKLDGDFLEDALQIPEDMDPVYGAGKKNILRPFKMVFYGNYRPLDKEVITIIPRLGFSISPLYAAPGSLEIGANARFDLKNMLITTFGINYEDRVWKNSLDFAFNFRAFELDLGASMQSPNFVKSWQLVGVGLNVGLKFGW